MNPKEKGVTKWKRNYTGTAGGGFRGLWEDSFEMGNRQESA